MVLRNLQLNIVMRVTTHLIDLFRPCISANANLKANTRVVYSSGHNNNIVGY